MKKFLVHFIRDESGQSLMEIIVGLTIGAILIGTASFGIAFTLRSTSTNQNLGNASQLTQGIINNVQTLSFSNWQNIYGLDKSSTNQYFLNASGTSYVAVKGQEGMIDNDVTNGLVAEWKFDEATTTTSTVVYDSSGNNEVGVIAGPVLRATSTCKISNCMSFDGTNLVNVAATSTLNFTTNGTFSIAAWVYPNTFTTTWRRGIMRMENYTVSGFRFGFSATGQPLFWTSQSGGGLQLGGSTNLTLNQWNHLAVTFDNQQGTMYLNGIQVASSTGSYIAGNNILRLGDNVNSEQFSGLMDDVRFYNRALSASEAKQILNSQSFTRYFYVENVCRTADSVGSISTTTSPCPGGTADDPLTQRVTAITSWIVGAGPDQVSLARYITRWNNFAIRQTDWAGSGGQEGPLGTPNNQFASATNITSTSTLGSFKINSLSPQ